MFSADPSTWARRYFRSTPISKTGTFRTSPHRRGEYFIAALDPAATFPEYGDRNGLAELAKIAERVTLGEEEDRTMDLIVRTRIRN